MLTPLEEQRSTRRKRRTRRALEGVGVALALLAAVEVGFRVVADGHPDEHVRLGAMALSMAAGAFVAAMRGGAAAVLLAVALVSWPAGAADVNRQYNQTIASAACPTGTPGTLPDLGEPGISMANLRAWKVTVCPTLGQTFTGAGGWKVCVFHRAPGPNKWSSTNLFFDMADDGRGNPVVTTLSNPCHTYFDVEVGVDDGDLVFVYPTTTLGVSGGTAVSVYLKGQYRR